MTAQKDHYNLKALLFQSNGVDAQRESKLGSPNGYWLISRKPNIDGHSKIPSVFVSDTDTPGTLLHTCIQCVGGKKRNFFNSKYSFDYKYAFTDFDNCY